MELEHSEILAEIRGRAGILKIREIKLNEIDKCLALQDTLTEKELGAFSKRSPKIYHEIIAKGVAIGIFNESDTLIAQIATDLSTDKKDYIYSNAPQIQLALNQECYVEVGAAIVHSNYRGHGLLKILIENLEKQVKKLIADEKLLVQRNAELKTAIEAHRLFLVAGCNAENYASGISFMGEGFSLVGNVEHVLNDEQRVNGYIFAKQITGTKSFELAENVAESIKLSEISVASPKDPLPLEFTKQLLAKRMVISKRGDSFIAESPK